MLTFMQSAFWHGFYPSHYHLFTIAFFLRELQVIGYKNKEVLDRLPTFAQPGFIVGSNGDYAWLIEKIPFALKLDWLPRRFDPWMCATQLYYCVMFSFCGLLLQSLRFDLMWLGIRRVWFMTLSVPLFYVLLPMACKQLKGKRKAVKKD